MTDRIRLHGNASLVTSRTPTHKTSISCRRRTRATGCLICIVLYSEIDAQCDKLAGFVGRLAERRGSSDDRRAVAKF